MRIQQRRLITRIVIAAVAVVVLGGVLWTFRTPILQVVPTPPVVVAEKDNGRIIHLLVGQTLEVRLRANRVDGQLWQVRLPVKFLEQTAGGGFQDDLTPKTPGDGTQVVLFRVTGVGTGPLFMAAGQQADVSAQRPTVAFHVIVVAR